jgi:hypothetical protein
MRSDFPEFIRRLFFFLQQSFRFVEQALLLRWQALALAAELQIFEIGNPKTKFVVLCGFPLQFFSLRTNYFMCTGYIRRQILQIDFDSYLCHEMKLIQQLFYEIEENFNSLCRAAMSKPCKSKSKSACVNSNACVSFFGQAYLSLSSFFCNRQNPFLSQNRTFRLRFVIPQKRKALF